MTDVELIDTLNTYLQHQPDCSAHPRTCGLNVLLGAVIQRLIAPHHAVPDLTIVRAQGERNYARQVPA